MFDLLAALEAASLEQTPDASAPTEHVTPSVQGILPGTKVGAKRWPFSASHPDTWGRPHRGEVLALNDPRVWRRSLLGLEPTQEEIGQHLGMLKSMGMLSQSIPVLWEFNPEYAMWEFEPNVVTYEEDLARWESTRGALK